MEIGQRKYMLIKYLAPSEISYIRTLYIQAFFYLKVNGEKNHMYTSSPTNHARPLSLETREPAMAMFSPTKPPSAIVLSYKETMNS